MNEANLKDIVWLTEERTFGVLLRMGAYFSLIAYSKEGFRYEVEISNDEWKFYITEGELDAD